MVQERGLDITDIRGDITMDHNNPVIKNMANPHELERMYRKDPEAFRKAFLYAWEQNPDSPVLAVWYERLHFKETETTEKASLLPKDFAFTAMLAIMPG